MTRLVMSTLVLPMASPKSFKRTYEQAGLETEASRDYRGLKDTSPPLYTQNFPHDSNTHSNFEVSTSNTPKTVFNGDASSTMIATNVLPNSSAAASEAGKKQKLTFAEKEAKRMEKEVKDQQKAEERAKKEEERLRRENEKAEREKERVKKAEEKRQKDEEKRKAKEERERAREEEKAKKDEERQKREEEKIKKSRVSPFVFQSILNHANHNTVATKLECIFRATEYTNQKLHRLAST